ISEPMQDIFVRYASDTLAETVRDHPGDLEALSAYAYVLGGSGRVEQGLRLIQPCLEPSSRVLEGALSRAEVLAQSAGRDDLVLDYGRKLTAMNPTALKYRRRLIAAYAKAHNAAAVVEQAPLALGLDPSDVGIRRNYILALWKTGSKKQAEEQ